MSRKEQCLPFWQKRRFLEASAEEESRKAEAESAAKVMVRSAYIDNDAEAAAVTVPAATYEKPQNPRFATDSSESTVLTEVEVEW
jgi:hypothetical protein